LITNPGTRNIPEPMTVPMIRRIKSGKRSTRRNFVAELASLAEFGAICEELIDIPRLTGNYYSRRL